MKKNALSLTKELIKIPSTQDNPQALYKALGVAEGVLSEFTIEHFEKNGKPSLLAFVGEQRPDKFKIILNGHLDVVPGKDHHYQPVIQGDRLFGVGALDMKASVGCLITVFSAVAKQVGYPLGLQLVTDEEIGGFAGTKHQIEQGVNAEFVIAAEPTNLNIVHQAKGILQLKITARGKTAHGAYPWRGQNAIWQMHRLLNTLQSKFPQPTQEGWATTVNLSRIETSNTSFNKIPDDCTVWLDIRFVPEDEEKLIGKVKTLLSNNFELEIAVQEPAMHVDQNNHFIQDLMKITERVVEKRVTLYGANGSSDARHFTRVGIDGIEFGPVGANIGADDEWVSIKSFGQYCQILKQFLQSQN